LPLTGIRALFILGSDDARRHPERESCFTVQRTKPFRQALSVHSYPIQGGTAWASTKSFFREASRTLRGSGRGRQAITWSKKWGKVLDDSNKPFYRWFTGGEMNTCYNTLDRHVQGGRADQLALIYDSPVTDTVQKFTYASSLIRSPASPAYSRPGRQEGRHGHHLHAMIPQAVIAMLACARLGAVHSVVFAGSPPRTGAQDQRREPDVVVTASGALEVKKLIEYKPLLDRAIVEAEHKPRKCIIFQRTS